MKTKLSLLSMKKTLSYLMISLMMIMQSCAGEWRNIYAGQYDGKNYNIEVREIKGPSTNSFECRIKYGSLKPLEINGATTDWGVPYSTDIFGSSAFLIFDSSAAYSNIPFRPGDNHIKYSLIYIPSKGAEDKYTAAYFELLQNEWKNIQPIINDKYGGGNTKFIGIAEGTGDNFTQKFSGKINGKPYLLVVENDGRVRWMQDDKSHNDEYSGLSLKVQMPGKKIFFQRKENAITPEMLKDFKNKYGSNPLQNFDFEEGEVHSADEPAPAIDAALKSRLCREWKVLHATPDVAYPPSLSANAVLSIKENNTVTISNGSDAIEGQWAYTVNDSSIVIWGNDKIDKTYTLVKCEADSLVLDYFLDTGDGKKATLYLVPKD